MCSSHQGQLRRVRCQKRPTKQHPLQALLSPPTKGLQEGCSAKYKKRRARRQRRSLAKPAEMRPPKQYNRNETRRRRAAPCWEVLGDPQKRNSATGERCWRWCLHPRRARPMFERGRDPIVLGTVPRAAFCERRCLQRRQGESRGHFTFALVAACEEKGAAAYASRPSETSGDGDASAHTHTNTRTGPGCKRLPFSAGSPFFVVAAFPMVHFRQSLDRLRGDRFRAVRGPPTSSQTIPAE